MNTYVPVIVPVRIVDSAPPIEAVRLEDGRRGVTLRSLCAMLDIARNGQMVRIRRSRALSSALLTITVVTPGGPQITDILLDWAISIWASGLHISRLPEKKQTLAEIVQRDAFAAIERAFTREESQAHTHEPPPPQAPAPEAAQGSLRRVRQKLLLAAEDMTDAAEEIGHFETEYHVLVERVTVLEGGPASSIIGVSPQRLAQVYLFANRLRQRRNWPIARTLAGLAEHFRVADVYDLPEKDWPAILDWFTSLLEEW